MGNTVGAQFTVQAASVDAATPTTEATTTGAKKPACKACCACPETKRARDQW